jgi:hypothetical protein
MSKNATKAKSTTIGEIRLTVRDALYRATGTIHYFEGLI